MGQREDETVDWLFDATGWWLELLGGHQTFRSASVLLTPTPEHFPVDGTLTDEEMALEFFSCVAEHAGVRHWSFVLEPDEQPSVADALAGMSHPLTGPVEHDAPVDAPLAPGEPLPVPYDPAALDDPVALVASFARAVAYYIAGSAPQAYTDDPEQHAYLVDLGAVMLGFGVFLANASFRFYQTTEGMMVGWGYGRAGALSQADVSYALAIHAALLDVNERDVTRHLEGSPRGFFKKARKELKKRRFDDLERLRAVAPRADGPYRSAAPA